MMGWAEPFKPNTPGYPQVIASPAELKARLLARIAADLDIDPKIIEAFDAECEGMKRALREAERDIEARVAIVLELLTEALQERTGNPNVAVELAHVPRSALDLADSDGGIAE